MAPNHITPRLQEALDLVFTLHGRDCRKGSTVPVMAHLLAVCAIVQHDGGSEDEAIAALLHDSLEDKGEMITREEIERRFGSHVARIVALSSDTPPDFAGGVKPPWRERKVYYLSQIRRVDPSLLRVTVADKIDNLRAILADYHRVGEELWLRFNAGKEDQLWYYLTALDNYRVAGYPEGSLMIELARLVWQLEYVARDI